MSDDQDFEFFLDGTTVDEPSATVATKEPVAAKSEPKETVRPRAPRTTQPAARPRGKGPDLFWDLETQPDTARLHLFNLPPIPTAPDPLPLSECPAIDALLPLSIPKIEEAVLPLPVPEEWLAAFEAAEKATPKPRQGVLGIATKKRAEWLAYESAEGDRNKLLSVTPEFCSIAALGWASGEGEVNSLVVGDGWSDDAGNSGVTDELTILNEFWAMVATHGRLVGFNILHFDLPVIYARSAILGVAPTRFLDLKPWGGDVLDLFAVRFPKGGGGGEQPRKLKDIAPLYGVDVPAEGVDGGDVLGLMQAGKFEEVGDYVRSDVVITRGLFKVLRGYYWQ